MSMCEITIYLTMVVHLYYFVQNNKKKWHFNNKKLYSITSINNKIE
jgi:hypothetical protein